MMNAASPSLLRKPKKHLVIFLIMGFIGTNLEIGARWVGNDLVDAGFLDLRFESAAGWTSLWMFAVYGFGGLAVGGLNETRLARWPMGVQTLLGVAIMLAIEFVSGSVLNLWFDLGAWDYADEPLNVRGQICARVAGQFFVITPLAFWVDDMIRFVGYGQQRPGTLWAYYGALIDPAPDPTGRAAARSPTQLCARCQCELEPAAATPPAAPSG
jgi:hypothetical protein